MRLLLSVTVLLIIALVVVEASARKSNRGTDTTRDSPKSVNSKEVSYTKDKSEFKDKGNRKKHEVIKEKKQRHNVQDNQKVDYDEFSKRNSKERNSKTLPAVQKRQKSNKKNKMVKSVDVPKNENEIKMVKEEAKRRKRSLELEQSEESPGNDAKEPEFETVAKKEAKNKYGKKDRKSNYKTPESDVIPNTNDQSRDNQLPKETAVSLNNNGKINPKNGKQKYKKEVVGEKNVNMKEKLTMKNTETPEKSTESNQDFKYSDDLLENVENFDADMSQKSCEKSLECECQVTKKSRKLKSKNSNSKNECSSNNRNKIGIKKSKYVAGDNERSNVAMDIEEKENDYEVAENYHSKSTPEENEKRDCAEEESLQDNIDEEVCSTEWRSSSAN